MNRLITRLSFWYYRYFIGYGLYRYAPRDYDADDARRWGRAQSEAVPPASEENAEPLPSRRDVA